MTNLNETLKIKFREYLAKTSSHADSFSIHLQEFMQAFASYGVLLEKTTEADPIKIVNYSSIINLVSKYIIPHSEDGKMDVFELQTDFFMPIIMILADLRLDENVNPMALAASNCLSDIKGIRMEKGYFNDIVTKIISRYQKQLGEMEDILSSIE